MNEWIYRKPESQVDLLGYIKVQLDSRPITKSPMPGKRKFSDRIATWEPFVCSFSQHTLVLGT